MNKQKICLCSLGLLLGLSAGLCAQETIQTRLESLISPEAVTALLTEGTIQQSTYREKDAVLSLVPRNALGSVAVSFLSRLEENGETELFPFFCESLYLYAKPEYRCREPGADMPIITRILRSVSHLENTEYFSPSRRRMRTLYEKSYTVDNAESRNRIPDPVTDTTDGLAITVIQKDLTFGEFAYLVRYRNLKTEAAFLSENIDLIKYGIFRLVKPGNLRISVIIQDLGDYLLVYGLTGVDFFAVPGIERKLRNSFSARSDAIYLWFVEEYETLR
ncbi:MAG: hypothetical protein LBS97_00870 [Treponema sp.]|jgi:hypothetical protein|nr:hypothetical protein [Treponema sp.]